jgi:hypothetical protein
MKFLGLVSIALSAVYRESQYDDPLLHFLDRIDLQEYQFNDQLYDNYYDADIMAPAEYIQDQENYEGEEGNWVVQGYRKITVPYFEMADGELLTWQEYEPMFDESKFYADKSFREYVSDFEYERTNVQEYEDSTERVPQAMPIKNFFSRVGRSIKRGFQNAGSKIKKGFQKALPTLRRIGSAIGRVAQVALPSIDD